MEIDETGARPLIEPCSRNRESVDWGSETTLSLRKLGCSLATEKGLVTKISPSAEHHPDKEAAASGQYHSDSVLRGRNTWRGKRKSQEAM